MWKIGGRIHTMIREKWNVICTSIIAFAATRQIPFHFYMGYERGLLYIKRKMDRAITFQPINGPLFIFSASDGGRRRSARPAVLHPGRRLSPPRRPPTTRRCLRARPSEPSSRPRRRPPPTGDPTPPSRRRSRAASPSAAGRTTTSVCPTTAPRPPLDPPAIGASHDPQKPKP